jgi:hypothetical protein
MKGTRTGLDKRPAVYGGVVALALLLILAAATAAFAVNGGSGTGLNWRNEGFSASTGWTTGEIGPYDEGSLVPFRLTVTNPSSTKSVVVDGFSIQVTAQNHGVAVFDYTTDWAGPLTASSQDGPVDDMLRTTFPAGLSLAPGQSAVFSFKAHLAESSAQQPAAGMINGNSVAGFSEVDAAGVGAFGQRVPVKVDPAQGTLGKPAVDLVKSSDAPESGVVVGTTVHYDFTVTNVGDVPLFDVHVTDDELGDIGTVAGPLEPGASVIVGTKSPATQTFTSRATVVAYDASGRVARATSSLTISVFNSARIFGSAFWDVDANGAWDAGEPALPHQLLLLTDSDGTLRGMEWTGPAGTYSFEGVAPDTTYTISEQLFGDWTLTAPIGGTYTLTLARGQDAGPYDFGNN